MNRIILLQALLGICGGFVAGVLAYALSRSRTTAAIAANVGFLVALGVAIWLPARSHSPIAIHISEPMTGADVPWRPLVRGTVSPAQVRVYLLVRPQGDNHWWVYPGVVPIDSAGRWSGSPYLGMARGEIRRPFEIIAVASTDRNGLRLTSARSPAGAEIERLPDGVGRSNVVIVRRAR